MFCKQCGSKMPDNAKFCVACGTAAETLSQPVATNQSPFPCNQPGCAYPTFQKCNTCGKLYCQNHILSDISRPLQAGWVCLQCSTHRTAKNKSWAIAGFWLTLAGVSLFALSFVLWGGSFSPLLIVAFPLCLAGPLLFISCASLWIGYARVQRGFRG
jgi:hypothetical protein